MASAKSDCEKSGNKAGGDDKDQEQIRTSAPMAARLTGSPQRTGNRSDITDSLVSRLLQTGHPSASKRTPPQGDARLRVDRNGAAHRQVVRSVPERGMRHEGRGENGENRTCPQNGGSPCANGWSYKRRWRSQKRKYKRGTGKPEPGVPVRVSGTAGLRARGYVSILIFHSPLENIRKLTYSEEYS